MYFRLPDWPSFSPEPNFLTILGDFSEGFPWSATWFPYHSHVKNFLQNKYYQTYHQAFKSQSNIKNEFSCFLTKTYVMGTQKNSLNETILLRAITNVKTDG